ncbi:hypothetical protein [Cupriavidus taiwanensis]|uniref:Uncharacterized protein n=1 Tax=Cupriavidus taiwanensis TaxID=164546 RepID=A0A7Z7NPX8_9BURK|nr:hypothetical protein [Cupriavidus taiwanensis]SOZ09764.1 conserved hypothetical protein [Cupriavidus taiwanensis]SOZ11883.1 conserved hypothetical protein [Cupriavidus taiwanensis]SOZ43238.1 conserved hypothetical protein [Cupriavidus taiwanensis]SPC22484.1 conserved hypothetical protein [Cupriavidus taiwanensis]SPD53993.1 conserved protein of unknown function [Cupriavidus taiwanensis]
MPRLELTDRELVVHLTPWESIWSLRRGFRVPLAQVRGATEDNGFDGRALGLRLPGTYLPGLIAAGTFIKSGDKQFVYTSRKLQTIVIELARNDWARLVIGVPDARAEAARINAAVARRQ